MIWRFLSAALCVCVASAWTVGQCPNGVCQQQVVTQQVAAVQQVLLVPTYFASYAPPPAPVEPPKALPPGAEDVNQAILAELRAMNKKLDLLLSPDPAGPSKAPPPGTPAVDPVAATVARVIGTSCIKCHAAATAEEKGGGFVMVGADSKTPAFSAADLRRIRARVGDGSMPKGPTKLTDAEKAAMLAFFAK